MKKVRNNLYEGMYILSSTLSEESRQKALDKILEGITEKKGEVHKVHDQGRRRLAYEVNGRREGHYYLVYFTVASSSISEMWKEYQLHEDLIRFMTLQTDEVRETIEFKHLKQQ